MSATVQKFVAPLIGGGLGAEAAGAIFSQFGGAKKLSTEQRKVLAQVSELYANDFTPAGAKAWEKLTGISISGGEVQYPKQYLDTQSLTALRVALSKTSTRQKTIRTAPTASTGSVKVAEWAKSLDVKRARKLDIPYRLFECYLAKNQSAAIGDLFQQIEKLAGGRTLDPEKIKQAGPLLSAVIDRIHRQVGGAKPLSMQEVRLRLPEAITDCFRRSLFRNDPAFSELFTGLARESLSWFAAEYRREVIQSADKTALEFMAGLEIPAAGKFQARIRRDFPAAIPKPTDAELPKLWRSRVEGTISNLAFFAIAQIDAKEFEVIRAKNPKAFAEATSDVPDVRRGRADTRKFENNRDVHVPLILAKVEEYRKADILLTRDELIVKLNQEKELVSRFGPMTARRWDGMSSTHGKLFPDLRSQDVRAKVLLKEVEELLDAHPEISQKSQVLDALRPRHPKINMGHLQLIQSKKPNIFSSRPGWGGVNPEKYDTAGKIVAERAQKHIAQDILASRDEIIAKINADPSFVKKFGMLTISRFANFQTDMKGKFPAIRSGNWKPVLAKEVEQLKKQFPGITRAALLEELQKKHPSMIEDRLRQLSAEYPGLIPGKPQNIDRPAQRAAAEKIAALLKKQPNLTHAQIGKALRPKLPWLRDVDVPRLIESYRKELFPKLRAAKLMGVHAAGDSSAVKGLQTLLLHLLPPGTPSDKRAEALNRLFERFGLPPGDVSKLPSDLEIGAEQTSRILAEYALQAKKGAPEADILVAVSKDYPTLADAKVLNRFRAKWKEDPKAYTALTPFRKGSSISLEGQGKQLKEPRYVGGWDPEKVIAGAEGAEAETLRRLSEYARIPLHLPLLDAALSEVGQKMPLAKANLVVVSSMDSSVVPLLHALKTAGAKLDRTQLVGATDPSEVVQEVLEKDGVKPKLPGKGGDAQKTLRAAFNDAAKAHTKNKDPIVAVDPDGSIASLLKEAEFTQLRDSVRLVSMTDSARDAARDLMIPFVDLTTSLAQKKSEILLAKAYGDGLTQKLSAAGHDVNGLPTTVVGFDLKGEAAAKALTAGGAKVSVAEANPERAKAAKAKGYAVVASPLSNTTTALHQRSSISGGPDTYSQVISKSGVYVSSKASGRALEIGTLLAGGVAPDSTQIERATLFSALVQAASVPSFKRLVPFSPVQDKEILRRASDLKPDSTGAVSSPSWKNALVELATDLGI